ncbi:hypothetical protein JCM11957_06270 [Caminibacter profundus]
MKSKQKIISLIIFNIVVTISLYLFHRISEDFFINSDKILHHISNIQINENKIKAEILYINIYLFKEVDTLGKLINSQLKEIEILKNNKTLKRFYPKTYEELLIYEKRFLNYKKTIYEQLKYSIPIKNSIIYLSNLMPKIELKDKKHKRVIFQLLSKIYFSNRSLLELKLGNISYYKNILSTNSIYNRTFLNHLRMIKNNFNLSINKLKALLNYDFGSEKVSNCFFKENEKLLKVFETILISIVILVFLILTLLTYLIYKLDKNYRKIEKLHLFDNLTNLKNRISYEKDLKKLKNDKNTLILIDIDNFKHYNDFYGSEFGDSILKNFSNALDKIVNIISYRIEVYRVGADEFALLCHSIEQKDAVIVAKEIDKKIKREKLKVLETEVSLSVSIGITDKRPYLENADLALKEAKSNIKENIVLYKDEFSEKLKANINRIKEIKEAIDNVNNNLLTYKQGICDSNKNIIKYELLTRVKINNEVRSIFPYLGVLKDIKQYHLVTLHILKDALNIVKNYKQKVSINISTEDLLDLEIVSFIEKNFFNKNLGQYITFELLETEFANYEILTDFIKKAKKFGSQIAIDDFGSGYSNFERLIQFDVDYIKIDGSLIKNVLDNKASENLLELLIEFAKKQNIKTIAEFVSNEEIFKKLKDKGVLYFQGFYLHKPEFFEEK